MKKGILPQEVIKSKYTKVKRNNELYQDHLDGMGYTALSFKYKLSTSRISELIIRERKEREASK